MTTPVECVSTIDPLKLVRQGTSQDGRLSMALQPDYAPVNERGVAHGIVFAQGYAALLKYFDDENKTLGEDWTPFFANDVAVQLATAAIEDVETYKADTHSSFEYLNRLENQAKDGELKDRLGFLYAHVATLARELDLLKERLPAETALKGTLQNLIRSQLAPAFKRLIGYYKAAVTRGVVNPVAPTPEVRILRSLVVSFETVLGEGLSEDYWSGATDWSAYRDAIPADASVYGPAAGSVFAQVNHCATHTLFRSVFDQFLKVFARVVSDAAAQLDDALTRWDKHEPHYALYLAFLRLLEYARTSGNGLTGRHLDFYYRKILRLKEKGAEPGRVYLLAELARQVQSHELKAGELFRAGKDDQGRDAFFANDRTMVANRAKVAALKTVYRHGDEPVGSSTANAGRLYASPVANSDDGQGAPLTAPDQAWHPFCNKIYADGALTEIRMPTADVGFAIASHHLLLAEGERKIVATMTVSALTATHGELVSGIRCFLTTEKGWLEKPAAESSSVNSSQLKLVLDVGGADPPIMPYSAKVHGYPFATDLPLLLVKLKHDDSTYAYSAFQDAVVTSIKLEVSADKVRSLAVSNDFGPVDTSKPFQPFGASPVAGSSLVIGSKEIFQKTLNNVWVNIDWLTAPSVYPKNEPLPNVAVDFLTGGQWMLSTNAPASVNTTKVSLVNERNLSVLDAPDFSANEPYGTRSRQGFARLRLMEDFGQVEYQQALLKYLKEKGATEPDPQPVAPTASALSMGYDAVSELPLSSATAESYEKRAGRFFHLSPFGTAERHPYLRAIGDVHLLPQFDCGRDGQSIESEAEFYIGISDLEPPQTLSLLFQVSDGTANPNAPKPTPHLQWSYLAKNEWTAFAKEEVQDETGELLNSGIVSFTFPRDATSDNILLDDGLFWIRAAVREHADAVCKLRRVAAQALRATFADRGNSASFSALPLAPGTIKKLDIPSSDVKSIDQPFASFGGRGAELPLAFYTRVSERLRHKDRGIDLWDYERLVLEAFPSIYRAKCLNHTRYEDGIYRELAPGHVTIVTILKIEPQSQSDLLKPYTSFGLLQEIETFLKKRVGCFTRLHVRNPRFEEVRVRFNVRLRPGYDEAFSINALKQAITRFLSPWAFSEERTPVFGERIYKSVLIDFVEDQPYVDYVTDFQLFHDIDGAQGTEDLDEVEGSTAASILVSVPAASHDMTVIKPEQEGALGEACACSA